MYALEWLIGVGAGAFLIGGIAGYLLRQLAFGGSRKEADLARALSEREEELAAYKQEVLERFSDTADKFRRLNESYSDLHQQLAESAVALCGEQATSSLLEAPKEAEDDAPDPVAAEVVAEAATDEPEAAEANPGEAAGPSEAADQSAPSPESNSARS